MELLLVSLASLLAGFVDAIVGGGGLILVPALFAVFPTTHPATLFGVNKGASVWGTAVATVQYGRRVDLRWSALLPAASAGFCGALAGAWLVTLIDPGFLRKVLPGVLLAVLAYTLAKKDLGRHHAPRFEGRAETDSGKRGPSRARMPGMAAISLQARSRQTRSRSDAESSDRTSSAHANWPVMAGM